MLLLNPYLDEVPIVLELLFLLRHIFRDMRHHSSQPRIVDLYCYDDDSKPIVISCVGSSPTVDANLKRIEQGLHDKRLTRRDYRCPCC